MPLERRDVEASLERKGFVLSDGDHRFFTYHTVAGRKTSVWTKTSLGTAHKTLGDDLVSKMSKQCGLTTKQFKELIACPLTRDKMELIFLDSGRIA
jgi:predicted RNA binding protein YcfA (HicA-like mRNA interferase family)